MKKLSLIFALLLSLGSFVKVSAFNHLYESQAVFASLQKRAGQILPYKKAVVLQVAYLMDIIQNNEPEGKSEEILSSYNMIQKFLKSFTSDKFALIDLINLKASSIDKAEALKTIKNEICDFIRNQSPAQAEEIIAASSFLSKEPAQLEVSLSSSSSSISSPISVLQILQDINPRRPLVVEGSTHGVQGKLVQPEVLTMTLVTPNNVNISTPASRSNFLNPTPLPIVLAVVSANNNNDDHITFPGNEVPAKSNYSKYMKSTAALLASAGLYKLSTTEMLQKDPRLAQAAKLASALSSVYGIYNAFKK